MLETMVNGGRDLNKAARHYLGLVAHTGRKETFTFASPMQDEQHFCQRRARWGDMGKASNWLLGRLRTKGSTEFKSR
ncbi:hypothetical protein CORC01_02583 [Colletotrichum orchidophilum]|uniref:Uncharacterized protein n=1 Tax=Colletotrichum orchidophilum TaxID=1209926 RepID=A0A1G4BKQ7_9PEZI|nr:uncharacterized protein CORC01_02583 [Colletotrichum orchidophilum]OHF02004.1 hypothetical protein CORC01_02583 [Colletotrichum orchidophilum]